MLLPDPRATRTVPPRALLLSLATLSVPVVGALGFPEGFGEYAALLWLLALVPAFLLAYYRGWKGVATALALGMATLAITEVIAIGRGRAVPDMLFGIVVAYLAIALGIGWLAEILHRDRQEIEDLAFTDLLTRLPNRRHALVFLENEFAAAERGRLLSVVLFDLDQFKQYNDTYGHQAGDLALELFAEVLARTTRRMNLSARFGGEEFLSVLAGSDAEGAYTFAERVRSALRAKNLGSPPLTVSAGVAIYEAGMQRPDELLAAADKSLYQAKREGRNRVLVHGHPDLPAAIARAAEARRTGGEAAVRPPPVPEVAAAPAPPSLGQGRKVLLAEDDEQVRRLIAGFMAREGLVVTEARDVPSALARLDVEYDVVLTDIRMPGASGDRLVAEVKRRWPATQVIVITGLQDAQVATDALNAGPDRYLFKPFGMPELRGHLADALARREKFLAEGLAASFSPFTSPRQVQQSRTAVLRGVRALVRAAEKRDPHARGHALQVAEYSRVIADAIDPTGELLDRDALQLACEVHDVGIIAVPEGIIEKEGRLSAEELHKVRQHPLMGRRMLEPLLDDRIVLDVVRSHHEWWDGSGYPDGLAGERIPLSARVVALAEAVAAMTRPRAYRGALPWEEAMGEVHALSGRQFDPGLVARLELVLDELKRLDRVEPTPRMGEGAEPAPTV